MQRPLLPDQSRVLRAGLRRPIARHVQEHRRHRASHPPRPDPGESAGPALGRRGLVPRLQRPVGRGEVPRHPAPAPLREPPAVHHPARVLQGGVRRSDVVILHQEPRQRPDLHDHDPPDPEALDRSDDLQAHGRAHDLGSHGRAYDLGSHGRADPGSHGRAVCQADELPLYSADDAHSHGGADDDGADSHPVRRDVVSQLLRGVLLQQASSAGQRRCTFQRQQGKLLQWKLQLALRPVHGRRALKVFF